MANVRFFSPELDAIRSRFSGDPELYNLLLRMTNELGALRDLTNATHIGLPVYANNAAAVLAGLAVGAVYRTGADPDAISVVH